MERRVLGKTGLSASVIGFGCWHILEISSMEAEKLILYYLDRGGNYIDTADSYGNGESEIKVGRAISGRRSEVILATKTDARDKGGCLASIDTSLRRLNTDYIDVYIVHAVASMGELDRILGPSGAMEGIVKAREEGKVRFIGISMHGQPDTLIAALRSYPFDIVMPTLNYFDRFNFPEIEQELLPLAMKNNVAVVAMKPLADGFLWRSPKEAFRYVMSLPVSVVLTGMNTMEMVRTDLDLADNFSPLTGEERERIYALAPELGTYVCRQCGKCLPCSQGIDIPYIFRLEGYYDRQMRDGVIRNPEEYALREHYRFWYGNSELAQELYTSVAIKGDSCNSCGECASRCPYGIDIVRKLKIAHHKLMGTGGGAALF